MSRKQPIFLRAGSLFIAVGALAFLVLHACSSAKHVGPGVTSDPAKTSELAPEPTNATTSAPNAKAPNDPNPNAPAAAPAKPDPTPEMDPAYFPATKAGIVMMPQKAAKRSIPSKANAAP